MRGVFHDWSKLHPVEYFGIGRQFYSSTDEEKTHSKAAFQAAKEHHRVRNAHEIDHWYGADGEPLKIPESVIRETIADWAAFQGWGFSEDAVRNLALRSYSSWASVSS